MFKTIIDIPSSNFKNEYLNKKIKIVLLIYRSLKS